jgi:hypothetical protein
MKTIRIIILLMVIVIVAGAVFVWSGRYNVSADSKHWAVTEWVLETVRERSIETASEGIRVPENFSDDSYYKQGAGNYQAMCSECHLAPGKSNTELRMGLYPLPPDLTKTALEDPAETFWIVKHGLKMTGMPAWGASHADEDIWHMAAFVHKLRGMDAATYQALVDQYGGSHSHAGGSHHDDGVTDHHTAGPAVEQDTSKQQPPTGHEHHDHAH